MRNGYGPAASTFASCAFVLAVLPLATAMAPAPPQPVEFSKQLEEENDEYDEDPHVHSELVGSPETISPNSSVAELAAWAAWLVDSCHVQEDKLSSVALAKFKQPGGKVIRGLAASQSLAEHEIVVCIPESCWLKATSVHDEDGESEGCTEMDKTAVHLAEEFAKGAHSRYASWFKLLPDQTSLRDHHPAFVKDHAHGPVFDFWKTVSDNVTRCAKDRSTKPDAMELSPDDLLLASVLVYTRELEHWGLVPVLDMVNAGTSANVDFILKHDKALNVCIRTLKPIAKDKELYLHYNTILEYAGSFFARYGFALDADSHLSHGHEWDICNNESHKLPEGHSHEALAWFETFRQQHCTQPVEEPEDEDPPLETEVKEVHLEPFGDRMTPELAAAIAELGMDDEQKRPGGLEEWDEHDVDQEL